MASRCKAVKVGRRDACYDRGIEVYPLQSETVSEWRGLLNPKSSEIPIRPIYSCVILRRVSRPWDLSIRYE